MRYIKFKLSYTFKIVAFFPNKTIIPILLKIEFYSNILNIYNFNCFFRAHISNFYCQFCLYILIQN